MTNCCILPWEISLQQRVLHELAKVFWKKFVLSDIVDHENVPLHIKMDLDIPLINLDEVLNNVERILNDLSKPFSVRLPKHLIDKVILAVFNLQQGYYEAFLWERKYKDYLPFSIFDPSTAIKYQPLIFIEPTGHFNDMTWVKLFVSDESMNQYRRFLMACFYCLEEVLLNMRNILDTFLREMGSPLENVRDEGTETQPNDNNIDFLKTAIYVGHEHVARFHWKACSVSQKENFLRNFEHNLIITSADNNLSGMVHFLYCLISQEHINNHVFVENIQSMGKIWYCLLDSQFYKCALNDILTFPEIIPISVKLNIFTSLILDIEKFNHPIKSMIFKTLWNNLSPMEQIEITEISSCVNAFVQLKEKDLLEIPFKVHDASP